MKQSLAERIEGLAIELDQLPAFAEILADVRELERNDARYRYLRDHAGDVIFGPYIGISDSTGSDDWTCGEDADKHIDSAILTKCAKEST
jgi:hypothetical protein